MELDQSKIINYVPERIFYSCPKGENVPQYKTVLDSSNLLVSTWKFGIDTTKNRWYHIGIILI